MIKIHCLQHVPFETPAFLVSVAKDLGTEITITKLFNDDDFPTLDSFDILIVLGGPMNINDEDVYPWLKSEKDYIKKAINKDKKILGICLGAQLLASILGAKITTNRFKEIGWYPISLTTEAMAATIIKSIPATFTTFHWHGDTFEIPADSIRICSSQACVNQGFIYKEHVVGLQFHLEATHKSINDLLENCGTELINGKYIQNRDDLLCNTEKYVEQNNSILVQIFNNLITAT
jgi:GMP synthase (glutamine-hydrolysing)